MESTLIGTVLVSLFLLAAVLALSRRSVRRPGTHHPPGPPGLPLLGNARDIPTPHEYPWLKYKQLCRQYGERFSSLLHRPGH